MPPKKSATRAATTTATAADAANFFQRGKKPTTTQRIIAAKKSSSPSPLPSLFSQYGSRRSTYSSDNDTVSTASTPTHSDEHTKGDDWKDLDSQVLDEIPSDDSWEASQEEEERATVNVTSTSPAVASAQRSLSLVNTPIPPLTGPSKQSRSAAKKHSDLTGNKGMSVNIDDGIHQSDLSEDEKMLRQFDLAPKYGPCIDLTRLERWERSFELGLAPPQNVKDLLLKHVELNNPVFAGRV